MSLAAILSIIAANDGIDKNRIAEYFVKNLKASDRVYHFDDDARCIISGTTNKPLFEPEVALMCNEIRDYCYSEYLFELAMKGPEDETWHD